jgi:NADH-quinone oxidoreductase subunit G
MVVVMSAYKHGMDYADVLLPIAPFSETSGTFVNAEGRAQSFNGTVKPLLETRPAWKVLRVLGNILGLSGFDYDTSEAIRDEVLGAGVTDVSAKLNNIAKRARSCAAAAGAPSVSPMCRSTLPTPSCAVPSRCRRRPMRLRRKRTCRQRWPQLGVAAGDKVKVSKVPAAHPGRRHRCQTASQRRARGRCARIDRCTGRHVRFHHR